MCNNENTPLARLYEYTGGLRWTNWSELIAHESKQTHTKIMNMCDDDERSKEILQSQAQTWNRTFNFTNSATLKCAVQLGFFFFFYRQIKFYLGTCQGITSMGKWDGNPIKIGQTPKMARLEH